MDFYYIIVGSMLGALEFIGIGIGGALYMSDRRARTEAGHYLYSPTYKPSVKTPKRAFIPLPILGATLLVTGGILDYWRGHLTPLAAFICHMSMYLVVVGNFASLVLLLYTTRPVDELPTDTPPETKPD